MILSAHQPAYLPWLGFFHKVALSDVFVLLDAVQFEKNSFINRNKIKTTYGENWLTIPVLTSHHFKKTIKEMEIIKDPKWRKKHWKNIKFNYNKAPFFSFYRDYFEDLYNEDWVYLIDILNENLDFFFKELGIKTKIYRQSEIGLKSKKLDLIFEMCEYFNADMFIFGKLGRDYADINLFNEKYIQIHFQDYNSPTYQQLYGSFVPNLSTLDLLFNVGPEKALKIIFQGNISKAELKKEL